MVMHMAIQIRDRLLFLPYTRLQISQCLLKDIDVYVLGTEGKKWMDGSKKQYMRSLSS